MTTPKAKFAGLALIAALVGVLVSGPAWANTNLRYACLEVDGTISELIKFAPNGTGWVNRTRYWFENWFGIFADLFLGGGELSEVGRAVIGIDFYHSSLSFQLRTILNARGEVVEEMMPDKLDPPAMYISKLEGYRKLLIEPRCRRYQRG